MNYAAARSQIKTGDVIAWRGRNFWSRLIRVGTADSYSHTAVARVDAGRVMIMEAKYHGGVRYVPLSHYLPCYWISTGEGLSDEQLQDAFEELGKEYSVWNAIRAWLRMAMLKTGWQCAQYVRMVKRYSCDPEPGAVVACALERGGTLHYVEP